MGSPTPPIADAVMETLHRQSVFSPSAPATGVPLDIPAIDDWLPWHGLPPGAVHEIIAGTPAAAAGFAAFLLGRLHAATGAPAIWCRRPARGFRPALYAAGLARFGLAAKDLIIVQPPDQESILWAMEEALKNGRISGVLGEVDRLDPRALRRLHLAAKAPKSTALLLRPGHTSPLAGPQATRWRVSTTPGSGLNSDAWHVALEKCQGGGRPRSWRLPQCFKQQAEAHNSPHDDAYDDAGTE